MTYVRRMVLEGLQQALLQGSEPGKWAPMLSLVEGGGPTPEAAAYWADKLERFLWDQSGSPKLMHLVKRLYQGVEAHGAAWLRQAEQSQVLVLFRKLPLNGSVFFNEPTTRWGWAVVLCDLDLSLGTEHWHVAAACQGDPTQGPAPLAPHAVFRLIDSNDLIPTEDWD